MSDKEKREGVRKVVKLFRPRDVKSDFEKELERKNI